MGSTKRSYESLKEYCLKNRIWFEDQAFPASDSSLYYSKVNQDIEWRRPYEITGNPKFIVDKVSRFDLDQGALGNCWYIAGAATLATRKELFNRVVPTDQAFDKEYAGIFRFFFWRYGYWREVVVDDRLPVYRGRRPYTLYFCKNREEPNEFWSALLEKAYAKLHGSYEALDSGLTQDALVDFTGGVGMGLDLTKNTKDPRELFQELLRNQRNNTLMGCSINASKENMEHRLDNGLVIGHAYSVTKLTKITYQGKELPMIRIRNPWGNKEWNGPWSDGSKEWKSVSQDVKEQLGLIYDNDGEFWMDFYSWLKAFQMCEICLLPKGTPSTTLTHDWIENVHHGSWVKGVSAGGCGNKPYQDLYWTNPQFSIVLEDVDEEDDKHPSDGKCTLVVSLMQKDSRKKRTIQKVDFAAFGIGFGIYKLKTNHTIREQLQEESFSSRVLRLQEPRSAYVGNREVAQTFHLDPGAYVIIPSTFNAGEEGDFILRTYTEAPAKSEEIDVPTGPIMEPPQRAQTLKELYKKWAGRDGVIDHRELAGFLNEAYSQELADHHQFNVESARSLLIMMDHDNSGVLEFDEVENLWTELNTWKGAFHQFDRDKSGYVDVGELRGLFHAIGYNVSRKVLAAIGRRYGGKQGRLAFNDLIMVFTKTRALLDYFARRSPQGLDGELKLSLDDFVEVAMYF